MPVDESDGCDDPLPHYGESQGLFDPGTSNSEPFSVPVRPRVPFSLDPDEPQNLHPFWHIVPGSVKELRKGP